MSQLMAAMKQEKEEMLVLRKEHEARIKHAEQRARDAEAKATRLQSSQSSPSGPTTTTTTPDRTGGNGGGNGGGGGNDDTAALVLQLETMKSTLATEKKRRAAAEKNAAMNAAVVASTPRGGSENNKGGSNKGHALPMVSKGKTVLGVVGGGWRWLEMMDFDVDISHVARF